MPNATTFLFKSLPDHRHHVFTCYRTNHATFGDDPCDVLCWCHVKGWVVNIDAVRSSLLAKSMGDFFGLPQLNRDLVARFDA